jgi:hypothetical protein
VAAVLAAVLVQVAGFSLPDSEAAAADTHVLTVTVTGSDGPLVGDVEVRVYQRKANGEFTGFAYEGTTTGRASFAVPTGTYRVQADEFGRVPAHLPEYDPDSTEIEGAADVTVEDDLTVAMLLDPRPNLSGRVTSSAGMPIPDVTVDVMFGDTSMRELRTDAQGRFSLSAEPGDWTLSFRPPEPYLDKSWVPVSVGRTDLDLGDQVLYQPSTLSGPLIVDPPVTDPEQATRVRLLDDRGRIVASGGAVGGADRWTVSGLAAGTYRIYVETEDHVPMYHGGEDFTDAVPIEVGPESNVEGPTLHQGPLPPGVPDGVDVSGVLRDGSGQPLEGV